MRLPESPRRDPTRLLPLSISLDHLSGPTIPVCWGGVSGHDAGDARAIIARSLTHIDNNYNSHVSAISPLTPIPIPPSAHPLPPSPPNHITTRQPRRHPSTSVPGAQRQSHSGSFALARRARKAWRKRHTITGRSFLFFADAETRALEGFEHSLKGFERFRSACKLNAYFVTVTCAPGADAHGEASRLFGLIKRRLSRRDRPAAYIWVVAVQPGRWARGDKAGSTHYHVVFAAPPGTMPNQVEDWKSDGNRYWRTHCDGDVVCVADLRKWLGRRGTVVCSIANDPSAVMNYLRRNYHAAAEHHIPGAKRFGCSRLGRYVWRQWMHEAAESVKRDRPDLSDCESHRRRGAVVWTRVMDGRSIEVHTERSPWISEEVALDADGQVATAPCPDASQDSPPAAPPARWAVGRSCGYGRVLSPAVTMTTVRSALGATAPPRPRNATAWAVIAAARPDCLRSRARSIVSPRRPGRLPWTQSAPHRHLSRRERRAAARGRGPPLRRRATW